MKNILYLITFIVIFLSCTNKNGNNTEVSEATYDKTLMLKYYLRADKSNFITAEIYAYHQGDTTLPEIESATLQGEPMLQKKMNNDRMWRMRIDQNFPKNSEFKFVVNHKGYKPIEATFESEAINSFRVKEGVISISKGFTINWDGPRIGSQNETMIIVITDAKGQSATLNRIGETAGSSFSIDPVQLEYNEFAKGPATISLTRKANVVLPVNSYYNQTADIEFYTEDLKIDIVD